MAFAKNFPRKVEGSSYPNWEEVRLTEEEEKEQEELCRRKNIELMKECINDAVNIYLDVDGITIHQTDLINTASSLFEKRASHQVYWKERKAKEKFDSGK